MRTYEELELFVKKRKLDKRPVVRRLLYRANLKPESLPGIARALIRDLAPDEAVSEIAFLLPEPEAIEGEIRLGTTEDGHEMGLNTGELCQHVVIVGRPGSGKTTVLMFLIMQLYNHCTIWIFDFKEDYPPLIRYLKDFVVINPTSPEEFRWNPLCPPLNKDTGKFSIDMKIWIDLWCETFCEELGLMQGSKSYLTHKINEAYSLVKNEGVILSLPDLLYYMEKTGCPSRFVEASYWQRVVNRHRALLDLFGKVFECERDMLPYLSEMNVIWRLSMLPGEIQSLVATSLCNYLMKDCIAKGERE